MIIEISAKRCILCLCSQPKMCDYHLEQVRKSAQKHLAEESQVSSPSSQLIGLLQCHLLGFLATMRTNPLTFSPATESGVHTAFDITGEVSLLPAGC